MRLPVTAYTDEKWRAHEILPDFDVEDVWQVDVDLTPESLPKVAEALARGNPSQSPSAIYRFLFAARWLLGSVFGWDKEGKGTDGRVRSLLARLPADLKDKPRPTRGPQSPFTPLYLTDREYAAEIASATSHGVLHVGLVETGSRYDTRLTVLVKPNGVFGRAYLGFIKPFRYWLVYPPLLKMFAKNWGRIAAEN